MFGYKTRYNNATFKMYDSTVLLRITWGNYSDQIIIAINLGERRNKCTIFFNLLQKTEKILELGFIPPLIFVKVKTSILLQWRLNVFYLTTEKLINMNNTRFVINMV